MHTEEIAKPWYREVWFWLLVSPMLTLIVTVPIMITTAFNGADDRVLDNYYKEGRMINHRFEEQALAVKLKIGGVITFDWQTGELWFNANQAISKTQLVVAFSHPADAALDFSLPLKQVDTQRFRADLTSMQKGRWYFALQGTLEEALAPQPLKATPAPAGIHKAYEQKASLNIWRIPGEVNLADATDGVSRVELKAVAH
ncbi:FixH family protein [Marinagarivorans algicola]|uniref:FixH family protein n=1 Tax=Marinagarivorans algicola TaxID=1513270 RepID=UPI0006B8946D|nr:FixH family protein [Marinagarivorans algicola]